jgi:AraC-like DNA-binding protein
VTSIVIDTEQARPGDPVEFWRGEASRVFQPLSVRVDDRDRFWAHSVAYGLCDITLTRTRSERSTVVRTRRAIADNDPGLVTVVLHLHGRYRVTQGEHSDLCVAGDMAIFDSSLPFVADSDGPIDVLTVALPKSLLPPRAGGHAVVRVPGDAGAAGLVRPFLRDLLDSLRDGRIAADDEAMADGVVGLVRTLFGDRDRRALPHPEPLRDIKRYIDAHLGDPGLTPERIAAAHYISRRRLYTLFEAESTGVREWIRARRLERCRRDLRDPARRHEKVITIATRWGFVDASHFSHCFRGAYGVAPSTYRAAYLRTAGVIGP